MSFRITACRPTTSPAIFHDDAELAKRGAVRRTAEAHDPGTPCRISLTDAAPGDELILVQLRAPSGRLPLPDALRDLCPRGRAEIRPDRPGPRATSHPHLGRPCVRRRRDDGRQGIGRRPRPRSSDRAAVRQPAASYLHVHYAAPGCYAARIDRV